MDLHPDERIVFDGHPSWRAQTTFERVLRVGTVDFDTAGTDDSEFRFVWVNHPEEVVRAVDRATEEVSGAVPERGSDPGLT